MPKHKKKKKKYTKIVELVIGDDALDMTIDAISLVTNPAIEQDFVYFNSKKNNLTFAKEDEDKRIIVSPALIPNKQIFRYDADSDQEYYVYFSTETVKKASELYLKYNNHHSATIEHEKEVQGIYTIESWVKAGDSDKSKLYGYDLPDGTWFVSMKIDNDKIWEEIKAGETIKGLSIEGYFVDKMEKLSKPIFKKEQILETLREILKENKLLR